MKEVRYYLADDGKRFEDEYDCINYEIKMELEEYKDQIIVYDEDRNIISWDDLMTFPDPDPIFFIRSQSVDALIALKNWYDHSGVNSPFDYLGSVYDCVGTIGYLDKEDGWVNIEEQMRFYSDIMKTLKMIQRGE